jgi:hypothetical protein
MQDRFYCWPQKNQAEVKQCGPYSSIVLAVLGVKGNGETAGHSSGNSFIT